MSAATRRAVRGFKRRVLEHVRARERALEQAGSRELAGDAAARILARAREAGDIGAVISNMRGDLDR